MNGVIHVGAHKREEEPQYLAEGRNPILWFDPQYGGMALGDVTGTMELRIPYHLDGTLDTMSASGLRLIPGNAIANGWTPTECETVTVEVTRFDEWAVRAGFNRNCSLLVIDVQGMEMQVLRGFGEYLDDIQEIVVEVSSPPLYHGGADANEIVRFLWDKGFATIDSIPRHGDMRFRRVE